MQGSNRFTVVLEPEAGGAYSVHCPAIPGCVSQGETRTAALRNIKEAIKLALEFLETPDKQTARMLEKLNGVSVVPPEETPDVVADAVKQILRDRAEDGLPLTVETLEVRISSRAAA